MALLEIACQTMEMNFKAVWPFTRTIYRRCSQALSLRFSHGRTRGGNTVVSNPECGGIGELGATLRRGRDIHNGGKR